MNGGAEGASAPATEASAARAQPVSFWGRLREAATLTIDAVEAWLELFRVEPGPASGRVVDGDAPKKVHLTHFRKRQ